jgi:hypothetical protein
MSVSFNNGTILTERASGCAGVVIRKTSAQPARAFRLSRETLTNEASKEVGEGNNIFSDTRTFEGVHVSAATPKAAI